MKNLFCAILCCLPLAVLGQGSLYPADSFPPKAFGPKNNICGPLDANFCGYLRLSIQDAINCANIKRYQPDYKAPEPVVLPAKKKNKAHNPKFEHREREKPAKKAPEPKPAPANKSSSQSARQARKDSIAIAQGRTPEAPAMTSHKTGQAQPTKAQATNTKKKGKTPTADTKSAPKPEPKSQDKSAAKPAKTSQRVKNTPTAQKGKAAPAPTTDTVKPYPFPNAKLGLDAKYEPCVFNCVILKDQFLSAGLTLTYDQLISIVRGCIPDWKYSDFADKENWVMGRRYYSERDSGQVLCGVLRNGNVFELQIIVLPIVR